MGWPDAYKGHSPEAVLLSFRGRADNGMDLLLANASGIMPSIEILYEVLYLRELTQHFVKLGIAWFLVITGIVLFLSPIPIGIFFIAAGLSLLIYTSDAIAHKVLAFREKHEKFNTKLIWAEEKLNNRIKFISVAMRKTRPSIRKDSGQ